MNKQTLSYVWLALGIVGTVVLTAVIFMNSSRPPQESDKPLIMVSIPPLAMIVSEIAGERFEVQSLLKAGDSPHTFAIRPQDATALDRAKAFIYVDKSLEPWALKINKEERHALLPVVPHRYQLHMEEHEHAEGEDHHHHGEHDPHFWMRVAGARSVLVEVESILKSIDPDGAKVFAANVEDFSKRLGVLEDEILEKLKPLRNQAFVQFHPSFNHFLDENLLVNGGTVLADPNYAPSAKDLEALRAKIKDSKAIAIFVEPQFDRSAAEKIAELSGLPLIEVDPLGGVEGRDSYEDLIRWNVAQLLKVAKDE